MKHFYSLCIFFTFSICQFGFAQQTTADRKTMASGTSIFGQIAIYNIDGLNSKGLDFCPVPFKNGLLLTSTRQSTKGKKKTGKKAFTDLYFAKKKSAFNFQAPIRLRGKINSKAHDGIAAYNQSMNALFFTRNKKVKATSGVLDLKIYSATLERGEWNSIEEISINKKNYSTCHPTFSTDGKTMYFASNRPGGYGGMDLYASKFANGKWQKPVNLGADINTKGNELFPSMGPGQMLYFSSNGRRGVGGLDLYRVDLAMEKRNVESLGKTFNTRKDEFGFMVNTDGRSGYFSSNQFGGKGGDDIYYWSLQLESTALPAEPLLTEATKPSTTFKKKPAIVNSVKKEVKPVEKSSSFSKQLFVKDQDTGKPIPGVTIKVSDSEKHGLVTTYRTDGNGTVKITGDYKSNYYVRLERTGYSGDEMKLTAAALHSKNAFTLNANTREAPSIGQPRKEKEIVMVEDPILSIAGQTVLIRGVVNVTDAQVVLLDECIEKQTSVDVDENGGFSIEMDCDCNYKLTAVKYGYSSSFIKVPLFNEDCQNYKKSVLNLAIQKVAVEAPENEEGVRFNGQTVSKTGNIRLEKIYYDFNAYVLGEGAKLELNEFAEFLKEHPGMVIELSSHTDAKGSYAYNLDLSEKRALSVVNYLVLKGVKREQIKPRGYGESKPVNHCLEGVACTEQEHKENRRTEFKVLSYDGWSQTKHSMKEPQPVNSLDNKKIITLDNIRYASNEYQLDEASKASLNVLAEQMIQYPSIKIAINAYADQSGEENYNLILSQKRARYVAEYIGKRGIPTTRFTINGLGESKTQRKGRITEIVVTEVADSNFVVVYKE